MSCSSLAGRSGCMFALIGFESIDEASLKDMKKGINVRIGVENYRRVIRAFHRHGIGVIGSFIIGNDHESPDSYRHLARFLVAARRRHRADVHPHAPAGHGAVRAHGSGGPSPAQVISPPTGRSTVCPMWCARPLGIETETIYRGDNYVKHHIYSFPRYQYRMLKSFFGLHNLVSFVAVRRFNRANKRGWKGSHYYREYPATFGPDTRALGAHR